MDPHLESKTPKKSKPASERFKPRKISYFNNALVVQSVDFPIFYIECISERHFVIAGGGGSSKTGVYNQINIVELVPTGKSCAAGLIMIYRQPDEVPDAIMSGSLFRDSSIISTRLVTGGPQPTIYHIDFNSEKKSFEVTDFEIIKSKQQRAELKCVKYAKGMIFTGDEDGHLTKWDVAGPTKKIDQEIRAHQKAINEIDVDLIRNQVVTLSREEGKCSVWDSNSLKVIHEFSRDMMNQKEPANSKYNFRSCRYAYDTTNYAEQKKGTNKSESYLLVACNPIPKTGPSKLYKWSTSTYKNPISKSIGMEGIMTMNVSLDGRFVAVGTSGGSVQVYEVKNLKQIYKLDNAHLSIVTGLEFLAPIPESLSLANSKKFALLSVSIDKRIVIHRPSNHLLVRIITLVIMVILIFTTSSYITN